MQLVHQHDRLKGFQPGKVKASTLDGKHETKKDDDLIMLELTYTNYSNKLLHENIISTYSWQSCHSYICMLSSGVVWNYGIS